jgi:hypothetical protein
MGIFLNTFIVFGFLIRDEDGEPAEKISWLCAKNNQKKELTYEEFLAEATKQGKCKSYFTCDEAKRRYNEEDGFREMQLDWLFPQNDEEMPFHKFLANLIGLKQPYEIFDEKRNAEDATYRAEWDEYRHRILFGLEDEFGIVLRTHGFIDDNVTILAIKESEIAEHDSLPFEVKGLASEQKQKEWREKLRSFCERANIPFEEPKYLVGCQAND